MQKIDQLIRLLVVDAIREMWGDPPAPEQIQIQKTRREFAGDFTVVVFPLLRYSKLNPGDTGNALGRYLVDEIQEAKELLPRVKVTPDAQRVEWFWEECFPGCGLSGIV